MGGRGSGSATAKAGGASGGSQPQQQAAAMSVQPATQPSLTLGGTHDIASIRAMSPAQFAAYMAGQQNAAQPMGAILYDSPTQRLIYDTGLNGKPQVLDEKAFNSLPGKTLYRTVNAAYDKANDVNHPADQMARQMMQSAYNRIGGGISGDGHYFASSRSDSTVYGSTSGNVAKTAVMKMKLNGNAKTITRQKLQSMLAKEPKALRDAMSVPNRRGGSYTSSNNNLGAYALYKGYNVILAPSGYHVILDRSAMTFSSKITAM